MKKTKVLMNKPIYLGQGILDISKTLMYEFYYDYFKPKYGDRVKLLYMDTGSFILHIETEIKNENLIPESEFASDEAKEELNTILEIEKNVDREKLIYKTSTRIYDFRKFTTIRTFNEDIYEGEINFEEADGDQSDLIDEIKKIVYKTKPKSDKKKQEKEDTINNLCNFFDPRKMVLHGFKSKIFLTKSKGSDILNSDQSKLKILTPKQMLQRLPIALAQVKAGNNSENLLNEIRNYYLK